MLKTQSKSLTLQHYCYFWQKNTSEMTVKTVIDDFSNGNVNALYERFYPVCLLLPLILLAYNMHSWPKTVCRKQSLRHI